MPVEQNQDIHCKKKCEKTKDFLGNSKMHHKPYQCITCGRCFIQNSHLQRHILTHKVSLLHLQVHIKLKPFQCNICDQSFNMKKYLSSHLLRHGEKKYACEVCQSLFKRQETLQKHMKSHEIRKMYKCPFADTLDCNKEFSRSDKLK